MGNHNYQCKKTTFLLFNKYFPQVDFTSIFVNKNMVNTFFPFKDQISLMMSSNIIYKYSCGQCQSSYIGEMYRHFISRICEHKGISPKTKKSYINQPHSNIREHSLSCDHPIISDNFSVLAKYPTFELRLLESICIHKLSPNLNNHNFSCPLNILN